MKSFTTNSELNNILTFLQAVANNNTREWFKDNRAWYDEVRLSFENIVRELILRIRQFDDSIAHVDVKDCTYRFYRDTRFSPDKSPYKRHFGAFISAKGRKSYHGGYYFHLQPGECLLAGGTWYLPSNTLREVRYSIVEDLATFRSIVEAPDFKALYPEIGFDNLKTMPKGFPKDFAYPQYIRPKVYSCFNSLLDDFFDRPDWLQEVAHRFEVSKPYIDFINDTIDDYEE